MTRLRNTLSTVAKMSRRNSHVGLVTLAMLSLCGKGCSERRDSRAGIIAATPAESVLTSKENLPLVFREVTLGVIPRAGSRETVTRLTNPTNRTIRWSKLRTSCGCLSVVSSTNVIAPREDAFAKICLDVGEEPEFVGSLALEVTAVGSDGADAFRFDVRAEVVPETELTFSSKP